MMKNTSPNVLSHLLICPSCSSDSNSGFDSHSLSCNTCKQTYFALGDIPCLFASAEQQKVLWCHQVAVMENQGNQGLAQLQQSLSRYDLSPTAAARLKATFDANKSSLENTLALFQEVGIASAFKNELAQIDLGDITEYYDLILRDWAWDNERNSHFDSNENDAALNKFNTIYQANNTPDDVLVLGAGPGRLSWDIHKALTPKCTIALDINPLLLIVGDKLIRRQEPITLAEHRTFSQIGKPTTQEWVLPSQDADESLRDSWHALGADVWRLPFKSASFDLIVTPWFIDVNNGDVRDVIGLIAQLLKPGGHWVNTGPLLFSRHLPLNIRYQQSEIKEFLILSGFTLEHDIIEECAHVVSPLEVRTQTEQVWTFCAQGPTPRNKTGEVDGVRAAWLIMHHLPIPTGEYTSTEKHPFIDNIISSIDGNRSINDICRLIAPQLPEGIPVKDAVVTLFGQILQAQAI